MAVIYKEAHTMVEQVPRMCLILNGSKSTLSSSSKYWVDADTRDARFQTEQIKSVKIRS